MASMELEDNQFETSNNDFMEAKEIHVTVVCDTALEGSENKADGDTNLDVDQEIVKLGQGTQSDLNCNHCDQTFKCHKTLSSHAKCHKKDKHVCDKCGKTFQYKSAWRLHKLREEGIRNFKCPHCPYSAVSKLDLKKHLPRHDKNPKYICNYCQKSLLTEKRLQHHIKFIHEKDEQYSCEKCDFVTYNRESLRRHVIVKHTDSELYKCPVCHVVIKQAGTFKVHMRIHLGDKPFVCKDCDKPFRSSSQLAAHRKIHGQKNFICSQCSRGFKSKHHLLRHEIIHTNDKPFACELCDYSCNVKANLSKHMKSTHNFLDFSTAKPKKILNDNDSVNTPESKRGEEVANLLLKEFASKTDENVTFDTLRDKIKANEELKKVKMETAKQASLMKSANRIAARKKKNRFIGIPNERENTELEHSVVVIQQSNNKNMPRTIAYDEVTGSVVPMSSHSEAYKNCIGDLNNVLSNTIIQFDECSGQIYQFDPNTIQNSVATDEAGNQIVFGDNTLHFKNQGPNGDIPLVIESQNAFTVSTLNCDVLNDNCNKIMSLNKCDNTKDVDSQIVFIIKDPEAGQE